MIRDLGLSHLHDDNMWESQNKLKSLPLESGQVNDSRSNLNFIYTFLQLFSRKAVRDINLASKKKNVSWENSKGESVDFLMQTQSYADKQALCSSMASKHCTWEFKRVVTLTSKSLWRRRTASPRNKAIWLPRLLWSKKDGWRVWKSEGRFLKSRDEKLPFGSSWYPWGLG